MNANLKERIESYLDELEPRFDPSCNMIATTWQSSGYHSKLDTGTTVHHVRDTAKYAVLLLASQSDERRLRGERVVDALVSLQDTDPTSPTFGVWPYTLEEPLDRMDPPDWNWADFIGAEFATALTILGDEIGDQIRTQLEQALMRAAYCIFRRNIRSDYTNIAVMGAGVTLAAGEILGVPFLLEYGRWRLENLLRHTEYHGDFNEYNSPTYTFVAIDELERMLAIVRDESARQTAAALHEHAWRVVAEHYHPGTGQLSGPHSRAYSDRLMERTAAKISRCTGVDIPWIDPDSLDTPRVRGGEAPSLIPDVPCPEALIERFRNLEAETVVRSHRFIRGPEERFEFAGTTWFSRDATLSSVNNDSLWVQRHPLIAYWHADEIASVFRVHCLKDGRDFASIMIHCDQKENAVLAAFSLLSNMGDYHLFLDHPEGAVFGLSDLRIRFELTGPGARLSVDPPNATADAAQMDTKLPSRVKLQSGIHAAEIHAVEGRFADHAINWQTGSSTDRAWVDAVLHDGDPDEFDFASVGPLVLGAGVRIADAGTTDTVAPPRAVDGGFTWEVSPDSPLKVAAPEYPQPYPLRTSIWRQR